MADIKQLINFGIINIDKPIGPTSFSVSHFVMKELGLTKASHMGTLDPKVGGVLPITLGRACRLASFLIGHNKKYVGVLHTHKEQDIKILQKIINENFVGKIKQTPPHKSAVKRQERIREVFYWNLTEASDDKKYFLFECEVEGGTYIRKLCSDLGEKIGGAHMAELRRTKAGLFDESKIFTLYEFQEAIKEFEKGNSEGLRKMIVPAQDIIKKIMICVEVGKNSLKELLRGKPLFKKEVKDIEKIKSLNNGDAFAVFCGSDFVEIAMLGKEKDIIAKPFFVFN